MIKKLISIFLVALFSVNFSSCTSEKVTKSTGVYFNTFVTLTAYDGTLPNSLWEICEKYDTLFSATDKSSDIFLLNTVGCGSVDNDTADIITQSLEYCEKSDGKLDITIYPLKVLWGFYGDSPKVPDAEQIDETLKKVNYKNVTVKENTVTLKDGAQLDLGAVAKGYIADKLAAEYRKNNIVGIIDLGGNIMIPSKKSDGEYFKVGIKDPTDTEKTKLSLSLKCGAAVTSGVYERNFSENNTTYHHILDVATGYPTQNEILSVTVISDSALTADALSTAVMCMGERDGLHLVNSMKDTYAVIIKSDGNVVLSDGLERNGTEVFVS